MKKLLFMALMLSTGMAHADAGEAFATGFANALNRSMGGNPNDSRPAQQVQQVEIQPSVSYHYDASRTGGGRGNYYFFNRSSCQRFINAQGGYYDECVRVAD